MSTAETPKENRPAILSEEHEETDEDEQLAVELSEINKKRPLILIEVVIFLYFFSLAISSPVLQFYLYQRFSKELGWNGGDSENYCSNSSQTTNSLEDKVQLKTNDFIMYFYFICNFLSFIPGLLFGNLTDRCCCWITDRHCITYVQDLMSKAVAPDEQGVLFSSIYKAALGVYEGLPFITMSGLAITNTIFLIPLIIRIRRHPEQGEAVGYTQAIDT
ncbi:hypothetical protein C0Q70_13299 [Pomacea canaliculata]|uniref:Uncharacterized protein n=1 Tax=Pomacea canaliculata TaxID=400727 RepID=A0A2T7NWU0_POMCA|nr:hypothetical protein C0Q70_13299 [Pomacea canaliculata]